MMKPVRVRFAPSPTGYLHIGGLRTALFNFIFARKNSGSFILRLEDTDRTRIVSDSVDDIYSCLKWAGIDWDEGPDRGGPFGPYVQSERLSIYQKHIKALLDNKKAYKCFCPPERLDSLRSEQASKKLPQKYDRRCANLTGEEIAGFEKEGGKYVVRLKIPDSGSTSFIDLVRGNIEWKNSDLDDIVLIKSDGFPTYHFANIVDDHLMEISHVMRGEEWISSTPKHVLLYDAFGWKAPVFVHLPVIVSPEGGKLSKRHGSVSVREFINEGFLPEAVVNFLMLLGWSYDDKTEIFSKDDLLKFFDTGGIGKNSPVFDRGKLEWMNGEYIRKAETDRLISLVMPFIKGSKLETVPEERLKKALNLEREKVKKLTEFPDKVYFLFFDDFQPSPDAVKILEKDENITTIKKLYTVFEKQDDFRANMLEETVRLFCSEESLKTKDVFHPLRVAVSGRTTGPGLFEMLEFIGKDGVLKRLKQRIS